MFYLKVSGTDLFVEVTANLKEYQAIYFTSKNKGYAMYDSLDRAKTVKQFIESKLPLIISIVELKTTEIVHE